MELPIQLFAYVSSSWLTGLILRKHLEIHDDMVHHLLKPMKWKMK
jgi:hypothetical protein